MSELYNIAGASTTSAENTSENGCILSESKGTTVFLFASKMQWIYNMTGWKSFVRDLNEAVS